MSKLVLSLFFTVCSLCIFAQNVVDNQGAIVRSNTTEKAIKLCFTGHDYDEGMKHVLRVLKKQKIKGSFFFTGDFVRSHKQLVKKIARKGHYVGAHSDKHLLYCDWDKRDSLLHKVEVIKTDIENNLLALQKLGIKPTFFMPPYEWYNRAVVEIARDLGQQTVNFSSGTRSNADYTTPEMPNYVPSKVILENIYSYEKSHDMNGFHLLIHPGTNPARKDKLYHHLDEIIGYLKANGYGFGRF